MGVTNVTACYCPALPPPFPLTHIKQTWQATSYRPKGHHNVTFLDFWGRVGGLVEGTQSAPSIPFFVLFVDWQLGCFRWAVKRTLADKSLDRYVARYNLHSHPSQVCPDWWDKAASTLPLSLHHQRLIEPTMSCPVCCSVTLWPRIDYTALIIQLTPQLASNENISNFN